MKLNSVRFGDCLDLIQNGASIKQFSDGKGFPITRIETLSNDVFNRHKLGYANVFDVDKYSNYILEDYDLLMSHINSRQFLGRTVLYRKKQNETIIHGMNLLRLKTNKNKLDPVFASYYLKTSYFKKCIDSIRKDAINQSSINISDIKDIVLFIPSLSEQRNIATILYNIDSKIEINNDIKKELENMIKELYDYWFVQFDYPGYDGKPYKTSGKKMVWNDELKRVIPEGWKVAKLKDIAKYNEKTEKAKNIRNYISTENMLPDKLGIVEATSKPTEGSAVCYERYNILISNIRPYFKKIWFSNTDGHCSNDVLCFHSLDNKLSFYLYRTLWKNEFFDYVMNGSKGSKMPRGDKKHIMEYLVPVPSDDFIIERFNEMLNPIQDLIWKLSEENITILKMRDELLPMLMNGQVTIK